MPAGGLLVYTPCAAGSGAAQRAHYPVTVGTRGDIQAVTNTQLPVTVFSESGPAGRAASKSTESFFGRGRPSPAAARDSDPANDSSMAGSLSQAGTVTVLSRRSLTRLNSQ